MASNNILKIEIPLSLQFFMLPMLDYVKLNRRMGNDIIFFSTYLEKGKKTKEDRIGKIHYINRTMVTPKSLEDNMVS